MPRRIITDKHSVLGGVMEITERIRSCITELDSRREKMATFEARVRTLIDTLSSQGETPGALGEALAILEGVLEKYGEIDKSCRAMIDGMREIGQHLDKIEDGRTKIVGGVENILGHLTQLDEIAKNGIAVSGEAGGLAKKSSKRVLVIRVRPEKDKAAAGKPTLDAEEDFFEDDLDLLEPFDGIVH